MVGAILLISIRATEIFEINEFDPGSNPNKRPQSWVQAYILRCRRAHRFEWRCHSTDGVSGDQIKIDGMMNASATGVQTSRVFDGTTLTRPQIVAMAAQVEQQGPIHLRDLCGDTIDGKGGTITSRAMGQRHLTLPTPGYLWRLNEATQSAANNVLSLGAALRRSALTVTEDSAGDIFSHNGVAGDQVKLDGMRNGAPSVPASGHAIWSSVRRISANGTRWQLFKLHRWHNRHTGDDSIQGIMALIIFSEGWERLTSRGSAANDCVQLWLSRTLRSTRSTITGDQRQDPAVWGRGLLRRFEGHGDNSNNIYHHRWGKVGDQIKIDGELLVINRLSTQHAIDLDSGSPTYPIGEV